jgi:hypothetical protein
MFCSRRLALHHFTHHSAFSYAKMPPNVGIKLLIVEQCWQFQNPNTQSARE